MSDTPDTLCIDKDDRQMYERLETEPLFEGTARKEQFLMAMALGFKNGARRPLENREGSGLFRTSYLRPDDEAVLNTVALTESGSEEILANRAEVFRIAEEYAHAGIRLLVAELDAAQFGSYAKRLEKELFELHATLGLGRRVDANTAG
jgi:hypothetical protein